MTNATTITTVHAHIDARTNPEYYMSKNYTPAEINNLLKDENIRGMVEFDFLGSMFHDPLYEIVGSKRNWTKEKFKEESSKYRAYQRRMACDLIQKTY